MDFYDLEMSTVKIVEQDVNNGSNVKNSIKRKNPIQPLVGRSPWVSHKKLLIVRMEDVMQSPLQLTKEQFLRNLNLVPVKKQAVSNPPPQPPSSPSQLVELKTTVNVPLTSEIGKKLLKEKKHQVSEDVLRRLERKNNENNMSLMTLSPTILQTSEYCRSYTNPKRQDHQIKNYHKQLKFCRPLSVVLEYCDLHKFKEKYKKELKENASKELSIYLKKQPKELTGSQKDVVDRKRTL